MEILVLIAVCLLGGWWLLSALLGGTDKAREAVKASPGVVCVGIAVLGIVVFIVFVSLYIGFVILSLDWPGLWGTLPSDPGTAE
jgi:hypothetical protein